MSECINTISNERVISYWKTFFDEKTTVEEINEKLKSLSNTSLEELLEQDNNKKGLIESFVWCDIEKQECLNKIYSELENKSFWIYFYEPIIKKYINNYINSIEDNEIIEDKEKFLVKSISTVLMQLHNIAYQTIIAEIYYAKEAGMLKGNTKEERGKYFSDVLLKSDEYRKEVYLNYPELCRILDIKTKQSLEYIEKIINDTSRELKSIEEKINNSSSLGKIKTILLGEGDTHNNGKTVAKIIFENNKIIMYKPHSLKIDEKYSELIKWINNIFKDKDKELYACKVHTIEDAGWSEYVQYKGCDKTEDIKSFYYKIGKLLCILHSLNGNDMHNENIIAYGNNPVLIDLETLIHPDIEDNNTAESAMEIAYKYFKDSVINTHLLPSRVVNFNNNKFIEIGGLGGLESQTAPFKSKVMLGYGTDEVKITRRYLPVKPKNNNPECNGKKVDPKDYEEYIIEGFKSLYQWILENKSFYLNKLKDIFSDFKIRILYRATNVYAQLLFSSFHPDLLTNYNDRYIYLHRLAVNHSSPMHTDSVLKTEISNMMRGDIPYFSENIDDLGNTKSRFKKGLDKVEEKVINMSEESMYRQIKSIYASFMNEEDRYIKTPVNFIRNGELNNVKEHFVNQAKKIADYMLERSIVGEKESVKSRIWMESKLSPYGFSTYECMTGDICSGLSGVLFLYYYLNKITKEEKYKEAAEEILASIIPEDTKKIETDKMGAFTGLLGIAYALFYVDGTKKYTQDIINILDIVESSPDVLKKDKKDIMNVAGDLGILISMYEKSEDKILRDKSIKLAIDVFEILKESKIESENGVYWSEEGYVGYGRGNAGIIAQLYRLYKVVDNNEILDLINEALSYEKSMYSEENKNWYVSLKEKEFINGWRDCAPGILLSKIQLKKNGFTNSRIDSEIKRAIDTTINEGLNKDITLSHGDMGNLVILKDAAIELKDEELLSNSLATMKEASDYVVELLNNNGFEYYEYNSFMLGLSGIAYEMLRAGNEDKMPNILGLE